MKNIRQTPTPVWPATITNDVKYYNLTFRLEDGGNYNVASYLDQFERRWIMSRVDGSILIKRT